MTPSQVFSQARVVLNDPSSGTPRWSDANLLTYYNDFKKALARAKGELFIEPSTITLVDGEIQTVSRQTTFGLVDVLKNKRGDSVRMIERDNLELQNRSWRNGAKGPMSAWFRVPGDPYRFICYPPATAGDTAQVLAVQVPGDILIGDIGADDGVSDAYRAAGSSYVAGLALTVNTNAADTAKGMALIDAAMRMAGVGA